MCIRDSLCSAMCRLLDQESMWLDVVSGGEYYVARESGFPTERLLFHGNNKSPQERELVLKNGIGRWIIDSEWELTLLSKEAKKYLHGKLPAVSYTHLDVYKRQFPYC